MQMISTLSTEKPGKPDVPEISKLTNTSASLAWKPPESDGGAEIFNYVIEYMAEDAKKWTKANKDNVPDLKFTVTGLKKGKQYRFRISAENKAGVGPASEPTELIMIEEPLGK